MTLQNAPRKRGRADVVAPRERISVRIPDAAAMLGIGRTKLYELIGAGEIELIKVGKVSLIAVCTLEEFIDRQRTRLTAPTAGAPKRRGRPRVSFMELIR